MENTVADKTSVAAQRPLVIGTVLLAGLVWSLTSIATVNGQSPPGTLPGSWTMKAPLPAPRAEVAAVAFDGKLHALVHSVAYAPAEELKGDFVNTTREGFRVAHDVSVYSLIAVARAAAPLMEDGGSIITMTYYGAEKVVPHYNVMAVAKAALECTVRYLAHDLGKKKIRVNAISAGPIKTLAARGISGLGDMLKSHAERAPLGRNVEVAEVGSTGVFLASDASSGITGEVIYVDCGYNIMGF